MRFNLSDITGSVSVPADGNAEISAPAGYGISKIRLRFGTAVSNVCYLVDESGIQGHSVSTCESVIDFSALGGYAPSRLRFFNDGSTAHRLGYTIEKLTTLHFDPYGG